MHMDNYTKASSLIDAVKENIRNDKLWIIKRWAGWKPDDSSPGRRRAVYELVPNYHLMTYDEMLTAQREISRKYPGQLFEGHRIIPEGTP